MNKSQYVNGNIPNLVRHRSVFKQNSTHKTSLNVGDLIPIFEQEVLPGDTIKMNVNQINRLTSSFLKSPVDGLVLDIYFFFVRNKNLDDNWKKIIGESSENKWIPQKQYRIPQIYFKNEDALIRTVGIKELHDYFGIPTTTNTGTGNMTSISQYYQRAYWNIWNEWFRNESVQDPVLFLKDSEDIYYGDDTYYNANKGTRFPLKITKMNDYFTTSLPSPQKGEAINLIPGGTVPVNALAEKHYIDETYDGGILFETSGNGGGTLPTGNMQINNGMTAASMGADPTPSTTIKPNNLWAQLDSLSINNFRIAVSIQQQFEQYARIGSRYTEILQGQFGVTPADASIDRPEYLGGSRNEIEINQVVQSSISLDGTTKLGDIGGYSLSGGSCGFNYSADDYGIIMGVAAIRQKHSYSQGIHQQFTRSEAIDFYNWNFANIGEQPVFTKEIFAKLNLGHEEDIFGYQEAWSPYRLKLDKVTSQLRPSANTSLDVWHFGDEYDSQPFLSDQFIKETPEFVDRTISVDSTVTDQFLLDIYFQAEWIRVMPTYSTPGKRII